MAVDASLFQRESALGENTNAAATSAFPPQFV
jgi:hypothetical protein